MWDKVFVLSTLPYRRMTTYHVYNVVSHNHGPQVRSLQSKTRPYVLTGQQKLLATIMLRKNMRQSKASAVDEDGINSMNRISHRDNLGLEVGKSKSKRCATPRSLILGVENG